MGNMILTALLVVAAYAAWKTLKDKGLGRRSSVEEAAREGQNRALTIHASASPRLDRGAQGPLADVLRFRPGFRGQAAERQNYWKAEKAAFVYASLVLDPNGPARLGSGALGMFGSFSVDSANNTPLAFWPPFEPIPVKHTRLDDRVTAHGRYIFSGPHPDPSALLGGSGLRAASAL